MFGINRFNSNLEFGFIQDRVESNNGAMGQNNSIFSDNNFFEKSNSMQEFDDGIFDKDDEKKEFFNSLEDIIELYAHEETNNNNKEEAILGLYNKSNLFSFFNEKEKAKTDSISDEDITSVLKYIDSEA